MIYARGLRRVTWQAETWAVNPQTRLRGGVLVILAVGFASALGIYLTAQPPPANPLGYEPEDTKKYVRDMEVYGGKANLLASEVRHWLGSLWHGKRLAFTVAVLTVIAAGAFAFFAVPLPPDTDTSKEDGVRQDHSRLEGP
jgi:hypothetical protein